MKDEMIAETIAIEEKEEANESYILNEDEEIFDSLL